jgi:hypothetical protein
VIPEPEKARHYLRFIGYYRLSGYWFLFQHRDGSDRHDHFRPGVAFDDVLNLYIFDRKLRLVVMDALERLEVAARTAVSDVMSAAHGPHWFMDRRHFEAGYDHPGFLARVRKDVGVGGNQNTQPQFIIDYGLTDIVAKRYDAGVRLGEQVAKDMIAVRIAPDMRMAVVGAPSYFAGRPRPRTPQDLTAHACINIRLPTYGGLHAWEFEKDGRELNVRVEGQLVFNNVALRLNAALAGFGLAYLPEDQVRTHLAEERLIRVLGDWCPSFSGYHLYYPSRRQPTPAFALLVEALRYRG